MIVIILDFCPENYPLIFCCISLFTSHIAAVLTAENNKTKKFAKFWRYVNSWCASTVVAHPTQESEVRWSIRPVTFVAPTADSKSCQLLAKVYTLRTCVNRSRGLGQPGNKCLHDPSS